MTPIRLALLAQSHHTILAEHLCYLFSGREFHLELYTVRGNADGFRSHHYHNIFVSRDLSDYPNLIEKNLERINKVDLVIILPIRDFFDFWSKVKINPPILLFISNLRFWLNSGFRTNLSLRTMFSRCWKEHLYLNLIKWPRDAQCRLKFLRNISIINLCDKRMEFYLKKHWDCSKVIITHIPFSFPQNENLKKVISLNNAVTRFVIAGEIDQYRKDYRVVIKALSLLSQRLKTKIEIHLLGDSNQSDYSRKTIRKFLALEGEKISIICYTQGTGYISRNLYDASLNKCDVIIITNRKGSVKPFKGYREIFGKTSYTGISFDMIRFAKPAIHPNWYQPLPGTEPGVVFYSDSESLAKSIERFAEQPTFLLSKTEAMIDATQAFSKRQILSEFLKRTTPYLRK